MARRGDDSDDFGLSSADEADLLALTVATEAPSIATKRKASLSSGAPAAKRGEISTYATTSPLAVTALTRNFGLREFRLKQEAVIARILGGGSAVVVFPTGGGKSLCYQIPALTFAEVDKLENIRGEREHGITLVVSPLIALMKDQVDALLRRGIAAACFDSTKSREQYLETCDMLHQGKLKLLYCAPERLNNEGFIEQMRTVRGGIRLVAVDEAHCISEWGHAFRPDYLKVSRFVKEIRAERVICLTATATPRVAHDICEAFDVDKTGLFRTSTYRPNLQLLAESAKTKQELYPKLFSFLKSHPGPSIVYVTLQKQTEALALALKGQGFKAKAFHAGMQAAEKIALQDEFMAKKDMITVATIAFGMGIDKADIRNVVHFNIPSSLESYSQEIGRAGRDGEISNCLFYVCSEDIHLREIFARGDLPSRESLRGLLEDIFSPANAKLAVGEKIQVSQYDQSRQFDIRPTTLSNVYAQLELRFELLRAVTPIYTKYSFAANGAYFSTLSSDKSGAAAAIKSFSTPVKSLYHIDVQAASLSKGINRAEIVRKLNEWNDSEIIELRTAGVLNVYRVLKELPGTSNEINGLVKDMYSQMEDREQQALDRTEEMLNLITGKACFSRSLAQHFGDDIPDGRAECGHCTWCQTHQPVALESLPPVPFNKDAFNTVLKAVRDRDDARLLAKIAFGITSPRVTSLKLSKDPLFGSMADHDFITLLRAFTSVCSKDNQRPLSATKAPKAPPAKKPPAKSKTSAKTSTYNRQNSRSRGGYSRVTDDGYGRPFIRGRLF